MPGTDSWESENEAREVLGIDGCRGGWVVAAWRTDGAVQLQVQSTLAAALRANPGAAHAFIDMPIGLPEADPRGCDGLARRLLGSRASTVFPVPCRRAVYAGDYFRACEINWQCQGRRLSRQLWNLVPKIIEVDRLIRTETVGLNLLESHPELCFASLNGGRPLLSKKRERAGRDERLVLLEAVRPGVAAVFEGAAGTLRRLGAMPDDLIDALVLAFSAGLPMEHWRVLPDPPEQDGLGLPMAIVAPAPMDIRPGPSTGCAERR